MRGSVKIEERVIKIERTMDGIKLRITNPNGEDVIEPILLPFTEAYKLGRLLISESRTGMTQMELLMRKMAEIEHSIYRLERDMREIMESLKKIKLETLAEKKQ